MLAPPTARRANPQKSAHRKTAVALSARPTSGGSRAGKAPSSLGLALPSPEAFSRMLEPDGTEALLPGTTVWPDRRNSHGVLSDGAVIVALRSWKFQSYPPR